MSLRPRETHTTKSIQMQRLRQNIAQFATDRRLLQRLLQGIAVDELDPHCLGSAAGSAMDWLMTAGDV